MLFAASFAGVLRLISWGVLGGWGVPLGLSEQHVHSCGGAGLSGAMEL